MTNEDLKDLIDCIKLEVGNDIQAGNKTKTTYKLPSEALTEEIIEVLSSHFGYYESSDINDGVLTLVHPDRDD